MAQRLHTRESATSPSAEPLWASGTNCVGCGVEDNYALKK